MSTTKTISTRQKKLVLQPAFNNRYIHHRLPVNQQNAQLSVENSRSHPLVSLPIKVNNGLTRKSDVCLHRYASTSHIDHSTEYVIKLND